MTATLDRQCTHLAEHGMYRPACEAGVALNTHGRLQAKAAGEKAAA